MTEVMFWDGHTRRGPMQLPTDAQTRLSDGATISRITNEADANACGFYAVQRATPDAGNRIVSSTWALVGIVFVQTITEQVNIADEAAAAQAQAHSDASQLVGIDDGTLAALKAIIKQFEACKVVLRQQAVILQSKGALNQAQVDGFNAAVPEMDLSAWNAARLEELE